MDLVGRPSALVRDGSVGGNDEPPGRQPQRPFVPVDLGGVLEDISRADDALRPIRPKTPTATWPLPVVPSTARGAPDLSHQGSRDGRRPSSTRCGNGRRSTGGTSDGTSGSVVATKSVNRRLIALGRHR